MEEITETLINNIKNVVKVLNNAKDCKRIEELKSELTNLLKYTNNSIDLEIWTPLDEEDRKEWN